ncbi:hypothetical protein KBB96_12285 [Luteolibacter ambystomatis]|uniref:Uncharacterized protein n=1 Tax=Luteolibacter ambystomatis TaxID=2824561 RepID=A0A975IXS7_9BACT|nr:hypothetical protein [Luteolibacter ambystomatis]QUE49651.1 hypothetical protein KBB96_12285 [Luteolibacter ambystomatis]
MKSSIPAFAAILLATLAIPMPLCHGEDLSPDEKIAANLGKTEALGKLTLDQKATDVEKLLGAPDSKSKAVHEEGGSGDWVETWKYAKQGIELRMGAQGKKEVKRILLITASPACKLATARGIKIGSTKEEVEKAYKDVKAKDASFAEKDTFVVGSISPGLVFTFKDSKVNGILFGELGD